VPPAGWQVTDIQCLNRFRPANPGEFTIDVTNGQATVVHGATDDQYCAFTNRKISPSGSGGGSGSGQGAASGISPTVPGGPGTLAKGPAVLRVASGLRFARATVRISRKSLIKAQLLKGERVVGSKRVTHRAGTHVVKVSLTRKAWRRFKRQGLKRVTLTLKIVVVGSNRSTKVFRYGVIVRL
jgi:hypothetical protein